MKRITRMSIWLMMMFFVTVGCEKYGNRPINPDSDAPTDVGPEFGRRGNNGSTDLGTLYGDLLYIQRDVNGMVEYNNHGFAQPLAFINGEPFVYTNEAEEAVQYLCAVNDEGEVIPNNYIDEFGIQCAFPNDGNVYGPLEVEFGRTSLFRAPQRVLDQAIIEAFKGLAEVDVTTLGVDFCGRLHGVRPDGTEKTIDSPRENLAIYQNLMNSGGYMGIMDICVKEGYNHLYDFFLNWDYDWLHCAAGCLSAANDKTGEVCVDKVEYLNSFKNIVGQIPITDVEGKDYFDFRTFTYDRTFWNDVKIGYLVWNGNYNAEPTGDAVKTVAEIFDTPIIPFGYGLQPSFTYRSDHAWATYNNVGGFAQFADDCNQVLEYVHEDSNIVWIK